MIKQLQLYRIALATLTLAMASCGTASKISPISKPNQSIAYNNYGASRVSSVKTSSRLLIDSYSDPFVSDKQALFALKISNISHSKTVLIGEKDIKCYVDGKEVKIFSKEEKLAHLEKEMSKGGGKVGKYILAGIVSAMANTHTNTAYYSGNVGNTYYSGSASSTYVDQRGQIQMNNQLNAKIDADEESRQQRLRNNYNASSRFYLTRCSVPPRKARLVYISPDIRKKKSKIMIEAKVGQDLHQVNYSLK